MYKLETWYDRTHNIVFDIAVTSGIFALIAYASIFLALFLLIYRTNNFQITQKWLLIGLLVAYGFQNLTVFDQVLSYILFYSIIAWIVAISDDVWSRRKKIENKEMDELSIWLIFLIVPVVAALIFLVNVRAIKANFDLINGLRLAQTADFLANNGDIYNANKKAVESLNRLINASNIKSYGTQEINEQIVQTAIKFSRDKWIKRNILEEWYITSVGAMEYEKNRAPKDARFPVFLAEVYSSFGQFGKEKNELELALSLSPNKQKIILSMANNALIQNNKKEALELSKKAYDLEKSNTMAELFYAISLIENKEMDEFSELANKIPRLGADDRILITLVKNEEYKVAEQLWEDYFTADFDLRAAFILGKVYNTAGYKEKAIDSIRRAMEIDPRTRVDGEKFIEFLRN